MGYNWSGLLLQFYLAGLFLFQKSKGSSWRAAGIGVLIVILINPVAVDEDREARNDVLTILIDESTVKPSKTARRRLRQLFNYLKNRMQNMRNLETRIVRAGAVKTSKSNRVDGTKIFDALTKATSDIPLSRRAGTI